MSAKDIALVVFTIGGSIAMIIFVCGLFSDEISKIIRALRGENDDE